MTQAPTPSADTDDLVYTVVINDEEQYSIWPTFRPVPAGWREVGVSGSKADCLAHIETVWTDMRPASLRRAMDGERATRAS
ncbi:MbtH family protein [Burkholderia cenocepacia]|uniref:MbtH family protein n=1 Tax=Burkholderia cenocepacia TaxID=95486 RepID=UPI00158CCBC7|nr:MbtH family protein [Burkholderia cenocepacia]